jgi:hypothetical protein
VLALFCSACSASRGGAERTRTPTPSAGPPPGASQAPGPPLATATASAPANAVDPTDPVAVATDCFARWQSFDARTDAGPGAGVGRARDCFTPDFLAQLSGVGASGDPAGGDDGQAWQDQRTHGTHSTVTVLAATPLGDTASSGRVVLLLNVRRATVTDGGQPIETVSTPTVTLLRDTDGHWRLAGADLANDSGDAPGR